MSPHAISANVRSMTGFARVSLGEEGVEIDLEARSVNHRFLDIVIKAPRIYSNFERDIKNSLHKHHRRGRIEVTIWRRQFASNTAQADRCIEDRFTAKLDRYVRAYGAACRRFGVSDGGLAHLISHLVTREVDAVVDGAPDQTSIADEREIGTLLRGVEQLSEALVVMREREGEGLVGDIKERLTTLVERVKAITALASFAPEQVRQRLLERVRLISPEVQLDPSRLATEVALICDRVDISEELARLGIHIDSFRTAINGGPDGVGRKLDFIVQEIGRELNTIGSKAQEGGIQGLVVESKVALERIREQVQNIE